MQFGGLDPNLTFGQQLQDCVLIALFLHVEFIFIGNNLPQ